MGDLDVETFLLSVVLERAEDELELIPIVISPMKTTDVGARGAIRTTVYCTKIDVSLLEQRISELLAEVHMHSEDNFSLLTMLLSLRHDCP